MNRTNGTDQDRIGDIYDEFAEEELARLDQTSMHRAEFALTMALIREHLATPSRVLDVGSGPGRYAEALLADGHEVGLIDLSAASLTLFTNRIKKPQSNRVLFTKTGSATDIDWLEAGSFDAVLMMGPLYHLVGVEERATALRGALRVLRPGGILVSSHLSPYNSIRNAILASDFQGAQRLAAGGETDHRGMQQYRQWPLQARAEIESAGFTMLAVRSLESVVSTLNRRDFADIDHAEFESTVATLADNPDLAGATLHFAIAASRPRP